jgi:hypothetical protein
MRAMRNSLHELIIARASGKQFRTPPVTRRRPTRRPTHRRRPGDLVQKQWIMVFDDGSALAGFAVDTARLPTAGSEGRTSNPESRPIASGLARPSFRLLRAADCD